MCSCVDGSRFARLLLTFAGWSGSRIAEEETLEGRFIAIGLSLGLCFGVVIGLLLDNIALIGFGSVIGLGLGVALSQAKKNERTDDRDDDATGDSRSDGSTNFTR